LACLAYRPEETAADSAAADPVATFTGTSIHWREDLYTIVVGGHRPVEQLVQIASSLAPA
jgi:hypothetical protein